MDGRLFAEKSRLKTKRDECGEAIVSGKFGQIYGHGAGKFGCMVPGRSARYWNAARRRLTAVGCQAIQNGATEGTALFDPQDTGQVKLAIRLIGAKRKLSESQRAALVERLWRSREVAVSPDSHSISAESPEKGAFAGQISTVTA